jgi:hypothetical protein
VAGSYRRPPKVQVPNVDFLAAFEAANPQGL